jgi:hypothetical protein
MAAVTKNRTYAQMGDQIYFKIAGYVDLAVLIIVIPCQIFDIINVFELLPKTCNFTICSIFSNSGLFLISPSPKKNYLTIGKSLFFHQCLAHLTQRVM